MVSQYIQFSSEYAKADAEYRHRSLRSTVGVSRRRARRLYEAETADLVKRAR